MVRVRRRQCGRSPRFLSASHVHNGAQAKLQKTYTERGTRACPFPQSAIPIALQDIPLNVFLGIFGVDRYNKCEREKGVNVKTRTQCRPFEQDRTIDARRAPWVV